VETPAAFVYRIHAEAARAVEDDGADFAAAYARAFDAVFAEIGDRGAHELAWYLETPSVVFERRLRAALARASGAAALDRTEAVSLVRAWISTRVDAAAAPHVADLLAQDRARRYVIDEDVRIRTPAGVTLSATLVRPRTEARLPTALVFTIYADAVASRQRALAAASYGYVGMVALSRGKGSSDAEIMPYEHEAEDAPAVVEWIADQSWSNGEVGMYGASYEGFAAWAAAKSMPDALRAIAPHAAALPGQGLPMMNNVFLNANYGWPFFVANNRTLDFETYNDRERWETLDRDWFASGRPYRDLDAIDGVPNPFFQRWLDHPSFDAYWQAMVPHGAEFARIDIPVLSITGYYDDGQISAVDYLREHCRFRPDAEHFLVIGPYDHFGVGAPRKARELRGYDIDPVAQFDTEALTFAWFDHVFRGADRPALLRDRVNHQVMGADRWDHAASLDEMAEERWRLHLAPARGEAFHRLSETPPERPDALVQTVDLADRDVIHNDYYPEVIDGGTTDFETGLAFISDPLPRASELSGFPSGRLTITINKRDVDLGVRFYEVQADGSLFHLSYWLGRASHADDPTVRTLLTPGEPTRIEFDRSYLVSRRIEAGHRILVVVDVNKNPWHQINYGTGGDVSAESIADAGAPLRIEWANESHVELPVTWVD
jgi:putative CocE/NonD family hydrolase